MYDSICIRVPIEEDFRLLKIDGLDNGKTSFSATGEVEYKARLANLRLWQRGAFVCIENSLLVAFKGSNLGTPNRDQMWKAFEWLGERLKIDIWAGEVRRMEFGANLYLNALPEAVLNSLGYHPKLESAQFGSTRYFGDRRYFQLAFYDKAKEAKGWSGPESGHSLIRFEVRLGRKKIAQLFDTLLVKDLFLDGTVQKLLSLMKKDYAQITEAPHWTINPNVGSFGAKDLEDDIFYRGIVSLCPDFALLPFQEGYLALEKALSTACRLGQIEKSKKSRLLKKIRHRCPESKLFVRDQPKRVLDRAISEFIF